MEGEEDQEDDVAMVPQDRVAEAKEEEEGQPWHQEVWITEVAGQEQGVGTSFVAEEQHPVLTVITQQPSLALSLTMGGVQSVMQAIARSSSS